MWLHIVFWYAIKSLCLSKLYLMKKRILKHFFEFLVIVAGISLSFYVEKQNAIAYKEQLKNQSLNRILNNIAVDIDDFEFNIAAHKMAIKSADWLIDNIQNNSIKSNDSIGYHLGIAVSVNTIFVDNQEEYRGLQNSGLIELIENEAVVTALQNKYTNHNFYKQLEKYIMDSKNLLFDFLFQNTQLRSKKLNKLGLVYDRLFIGNTPFPNEIIQRINESVTWHSFYLDRILYQMETDKALIALINEEINK